MNTAHAPSLPVLPAHEAAQIPRIPALSNPFVPSTSDLVLWAAHMESIAMQCRVGAGPDEPKNPFASIGALQFLTKEMHKWLRDRLADEERNLLLLDRLRHEAAQESAHERLMREDDDYAAEFQSELDGDGDEAEGDDE